MSKTVKTPNGTDLPLINLKGKDYLQVAHRLLWFNEVEKNFDIITEFLLVNDEQTIAKAVITVKDPSGNVIKTASATKRETKRDFPDHTEKAETSAIGRALALLGYGTQFAIADLEEGDRLADSPVVDPTPKSAPIAAAPVANGKSTNFSNRARQLRSTNGGEQSTPARNESF
jgi:hypothetical protein